MMGRNDLTTPLFWDCNCEENYIHPVSVDYCPKCDRLHDEDQPDAHIVEVVEMFVNRIAEELAEEQLSKKAESCVYDLINQMQDMFLERKGTAMGKKPVLSNMFDLLPEKQEGWYSCDGGCGLSWPDDLVKELYDSGGNFVCPTPGCEGECIYYGEKRSFPELRIIVVVEGGVVSDIWSMGINPDGKEPYAIVIDKDLESYISDQRNASLEFFVVASDEVIKIL